VSGRVVGTLDALSGTLRSFFVAERVAARDGFLQRRDPRAVLFAVGCLALAATVSRSLVVLAALGVTVLALARVSAVPAALLARRSGFALALAAVVGLPQLLLMPGDPVVAGLPVSEAGLAYAAVLGLRVGVGVGALSLLVLTTRFSAVVAALRALRVPAALVWVFAVTYRYVVVLLSELGSLVRAREARGGGGNVRTEWRDARRLMGTFLVRTFERGERVGQGMRARGGDRPPSPYGGGQSLRAPDYALAALSLTCLLAAGVVQWSP